LAVVVPAVLKAIQSFLGIIESGQRLARGEKEAFGGPSEPLQSMDLAEYRANLRTSWQVNWIDREATTVDLLAEHRKVVISGRMKVGKTREAIELIERVVRREALELRPDRIFRPGPTFRFINRGSLKEALLRTVDPYAPLLLFLDDFPAHFEDEGLEQLKTALSALQAVKASYVVATARLDQLTGEHEEWLQRNGFHVVELSGLTADQTGRLADNAAGAFKIQVNDAARQVLVDSGDGTPELTLMSFRRARDSGFGLLDADDADRLSEKSIGQGWALARAEIVKDQPAAQFLLESLAAFDASNVGAYSDLALAYSDRLWNRASDEAPRLPWRRRGQLLAALAYLGHFEIAEQEGQISYPDFVAEGVITREEARPRLGEFLMTYRRNWRRPTLRRFYRDADAHMWALFDMATCGRFLTWQWGRATETPRGRLTTIRPRSQPKHTLER
jgi:hypothetical protein